MSRITKTVFGRVLLLFVVSTLLLTVAGRITAGQSAQVPCAGWPLCIPTAPWGWLRLLHVALAGCSGMLATWLLVRAWIERRADQTVLPLATVTAVLFFGQAYVGAIQVVRGYPHHLTVLHAITAVSLWTSLVVLVAVSTLKPSEDQALVSSHGKRSPRDFLALGKPWIVALLLLTTFGGLVAGGKGWPPLQLAIWTLLGGALAASGSSALNQYIDRDLDKNMHRTARRPLPAGRLTPAEGLSYGLALCLTSYFLLACMVNLTAALLSLTGILYYVVFYSVLLKRATVQNIVVGGGAGAIPPMVGWAAATGHLSLAAWILFLIVFMWTPAHFWALAIVRKNDYEKAGIPMLPVVKGEKTTRKQILVYSCLVVAITFLLPIVGATGGLYAASAAILGLLLVAAAWRVWRVPGNKVAWTMYRWSSMYLMLIFAALVVDAVV